MEAEEPQGGVTQLATATTTPDQSARIPWWKVFSWQIYEAGDSSWSLIIYSTYFSIFVQKVLGLGATSFGIAATIGALIIAVLSPLLGAAVDISGRRQPYLRVLVLGMALCTAAIGFTRSYSLAVTFFVLAVIFESAAFSFFMAMVPAVSTEKTVSNVISGAVGISYFFNIVALAGFHFYITDDSLAYLVFLPQAAIVLLLTFPCLYLAPDFVQKSTHKLDLVGAYKRVADTFREARKHGPLFRFLIGDFLYENAVVSVIALMTVYSVNVMGFKSSDLLFLFGPAILVAAVAALVFGWLINKYGPKRMIIIDLLIWLVLFIAVPSISDKTIYTVVAAPLAGIGLAGVWSSRRVLLTALTPVDRAGEFWGLYSLSGRSASVIGDATWTGVLLVVGETVFGYKLAIGSLGIFIVAGLICMITLPDARPSAENVVKHA